VIEKFKLDIVNLVYNTYIYDKFIQHIMNSSLQVHEYVLKGKGLFMSKTTCHVTMYKIDFSLPC